VEGEVVALDESGRISFDVLQNSRSKSRAVECYVFDLLIYRGRSLLMTPLRARRELLLEALGPVFHAGGPIRLCETFEAPPRELILAAQELGLEGVVAKRKDSFYEPGKRSGAWIKYKIHRSQEFVVGGCTVGNPLDALIVGHYDGGSLVYVAKVRNGFVPHLRQEVFRRLKPLETQACPFRNLPEKRRTPWALTKEEMKKCRWVAPELVAQIEFNEWTPDGHLRYSRFAGLRDDKDPRQVARET
jgi:bifunctional non-homologous end joining protein LigD